MRDLDKKINDVLKEANILSVCENGKLTLKSEKDAVVLAAALEKSLGTIDRTLELVATQIELQKTEISNLKAELWKYIGIGIGASAGVSFAVSIALYFLKLKGA